MSTSALNTFVKDVRRVEKAEAESGNQDGLSKPLFGDKLTDVRELDFEIAGKKGKLAQGAQQTKSRYVPEKLFLTDLAGVFV